MLHNSTRLFWNFMRGASRMLLAFSSVRQEETKQIYLKILVLLSDFDGKQAPPSANVKHIPFPDASRYTISDILVKPVPYGIQSFDQIAHLPGC
jgi:hypothetical protein